jgi:hypothetical protein
LPVHQANTINRQDFLQCRPNTLQNAFNPLATHAWTKSMRSKTSMRTRLHRHHVLGRFTSCAAGISHSSSSLHSSRNPSSSPPFISKISPDRPAASGPSFVKFSPSALSDDPRHRKPRPQTFCPRSSVCFFAPPPGPLGMGLSLSADTIESVRRRGPNTSLQAGTPYNGDTARTPSSRAASAAGDTPGGRPETHTGWGAPTTHLRHVRSTKQGSGAALGSARRRNP